jgi:hypothetical protein
MLDDVDRYFQGQCETLLKTQERDLVLLQKRRDAEIMRLNAHLDVSKRELGKQFRSANADEVAAIATDLPPGTTIPKALQLQTVRGRPAPAPDPEWVRAEGSAGASVAQTTGSEIERQWANRREPVRKLWSRGGPVTAIIEKPLLIGTPREITRLPGDQEESADEK